MPTGEAFRALRRVEHCMGTVFTFDIRSPGVPEEAVDDAVRFLHDVDATFSTYRADSQISRLARGELTRAQCSAQVREVLDRCDELAAETDGYFSAHAGGSLDPSGYVKGWAIERASDLLVAAGSRNHCVNGGGDLQCVGAPDPGQPWRMGIAHPLRPKELVATVVGFDLAIATSGTAERGAHVLDPHTAAPPGGLASVTVVGPRIALADAYATAAFAMGEDAQGWLEELTGHWGFGVDADGAVWSTGQWGEAPD